jgi:hypothetical protein
MAQDFAAAFCVGEDDKHICPVDAQGVAFAAIQGLYQMVREKEAETASLQAQLQRQEAENQALKARVEALERLLVPGAVNGAASINPVDKLEASDLLEVAHVSCDQGGALRERNAGNQQVGSPNLTQ